MDLKEKLEADNRNLLQMVAILNQMVISNMALIEQIEKSENKQQEE